jgi:O-acetyl-ADP-ribose deacetylase (regulator of RNase III)
MDIRYVIGDATRPLGTGSRIIVHLCNDLGLWGKGFVLALSARWTEPEARYRSWSRGGAEVPFELGQVQVVAVEPTLWVANMLGQHGIRRPGGAPPIRYDAVRTGLATVAQFAQLHKATIHMPPIGAGLAGGNWETISQLIREEVCARGVPVTVYHRAAGAIR